MKKKLLIITAILMVGIAYAQQGEIIHVVFEPNVTTWTAGSGPNSWILIDMDHDGIKEWRFQAWDEGHQVVSVYLGPNIHPFGDTLGLWDNLRLCRYLNIGDTISSWNNWGIYPEYRLGIEETFGSFSHQIVCMRYQVEDGYCYGWIDFSVEFYEPAPIYGPFYADIVMHEMAYCTIPNYPLLIGQTDFTWDIEENAAKAFAFIHPNPTNDQVTITGKDLKQAEVFNALGQRVATAKGEGERITVDISALPAGVYMVNITDKNGRKCVRKVVKE
jgi:hypothetical protein